MARTKTAAAPEVIDAGVNPQALDNASRALATVSESAMAIANTFSLASLEPAVLEAEISGLVAQTGRALFEMGVRLCALRAVLPTPEWKSSLEKLGFSSRVAGRMMSAALKSADADGQGRERLLALPQAKVMELVMLDESSLDELERDGRIGQLNLDFDDLDRLSASELRAKVLELQKTNAALDRTVAKKEARVTELLAKLDAEPADDAEAQRAEELIAQVRDATSAAEIALTQLSAYASQSQVGGWPDHVKTAGRVAVEYVAQRLADLIHDAGVAVQFEEMVQPEWLAAATPITKKARRA